MSTSCPEYSRVFAVKIHRLLSFGVTTHFFELDNYEVLKHIAPVRSQIQLTKIFN